MPYPREATQADVAYVASNLRKADEIEMRRAYGTADIVEQFVTGHHAATMSVAGCSDDGTPFAVFGVTPSAVPLVGYPWMLGTPDIVKNTKTFLVRCPEFVAKMHDHYPVLLNFVDQDNKLAIRWLKWLGFKFSAPFDLRGHPFLPFYRTKD
ncbi:MAG: DUF2833 domain-containing protein [Actinobacteria bacterium]|nr:DUF2833 domain-containing protein [Actinomycetota bacterium]